MIMQQVGDMSREFQHGVPRRGYVLSTAVEEIAQHLRFAVGELLRENLTAHHFIQLKNPAIVEGDSAERVAWHILSVWVLGTSKGYLRAGTTVGDALRWFYEIPQTDNEIFSRKLNQKISDRLGIVERAVGVSSLLPYILEANGPGSRLSVRRDPRTQGSRSKKKAEGIFYTPPDVADFMIANTVKGLPLSLNTRVLDPAVGTGVFLRSMLAAFNREKNGFNSFEIARRCLFGCDIDALALDAAATVLLFDTIDDGLKLLGSPHACWSAIRRNLECIDTLALDPNDSQTVVGRQRVKEVFPDVCHGFDVVIGNPPYADLGPRKDRAILAQRFTTLGVSQSRADLYPAFVEQMVRLSGAAAVGSMVVPLSLACSSGSQFSACRRFIQSQGGSWRFAFFDRQPHALFGEDVKTRNAIVFWSANCQAPRLMTGPLRRWRGDDREAMFRQVYFTEVSPDIEDRIPKIHGAIQSLLWDKLKSQPTRCKELLSECGRATIAELSKGRSTDVYVAPTAYNFLGLAKAVELRPQRGEQLSENPYHHLRCRTKTDASCLYAILASNIAYWWWYVTGDGFHVNKSTLEMLPVGEGVKAEKVRNSLAALGEQIWQRAQERSVRSVNRGRVSYSFPVSQEKALCRKVDAILMRSLGLPIEWAREIENFNNAVVEAALFNNNEQIDQGKASMVLKVTQEIKHKSKVTKEEWREYTKTVWAIANKGREDHPAVYPLEIPHRLTKLFSFYGETVLDPFAGTGTTARAAIPLGRRAICVDQNPSYVDIIKKECASLRNGHGPEFSPLEAVNGDSRNMSFIQSNSVGLVVTSPPYWDKANYGDNHSNIGNVKGYGEFFSEIRPVFEECYRVLAPGRKLCLVTANVNQHTDQGLLTFPLATDFAVLLRNIGFVMINEIIWSKDGTGGKWGSFGAQRPIFGSYPYPPNFLFKNVHEYILIFAKPSLTKTKGPKVKPYRDVMRGMDISSPSSIIDTDLPAYAVDGK